MKAWIRKVMGTVCDLFPREVMTSWAVFTMITDELGSIISTTWASGPKRSGETQRGMKRAFLRTIEWLVASSARFMYHVRKHWWTCISAGTTCLPGDLLYRVCLSVQHNAEIGIWDDDDDDDEINWLMIAYERLDIFPLNSINTTWPTVLSLFLPRFHNKAWHRHTTSVWSHDQHL